MSFGASNSSFGTSNSSFGTRPTAGTSSFTQQNLFFGFGGFTATTNTPDTGQSCKETENNVSSEDIFRSQNHPSFGKDGYKNCCGICLTAYISPRILPCKHIFCHLCIRKLADKKDDKSLHVKVKKATGRHHKKSIIDPFSCPLCREEFNLSIHGIDNLPMYFEDEHTNDSDKATDEDVDKDAIDDADEAINDVMDNQKVVCVVCENSVPAEYECFQCQKVFCGSCKTNHDIWLKHEVKDLKLDISEEKCLNHPEVEVGYVCLDCDSTLCKECVKSEHSQHQTQTIKSYLIEIDGELKYYSSYIEKKLETVEMSKDMFTLNTESDVLQNIEYIKSLKEDFKMDLEKACQSENKKQHKGKTLLNKINFLGTRVKKSLIQKKFNQKLMSEIKELKEKITTHEKFYLPYNVDDIINNQIGKMDVQMGRLFVFQFKEIGYRQFNFFFGNLHWTLSTSRQSNNVGQAGSSLFGVQSPSPSPSPSVSLILTPFIKPKVTLLIEYITSDVTIYVEGGTEDETVLRKFSKTFRSAEDQLKWDFKKFVNISGVKVLFQKTNIKRRAQVE